MAYCMFSFINTVVYCIPAGWLWGEHGFLYKMGAIDIAGSAGVHMVGGVSGENDIRQVRALRIAVFHPAQTK